MDDMFRNINFICDNNGIETVPVEAGSFVDGLVTKEVSFELSFVSSFEENSKLISEYKDRISESVKDHAIDGMLYIRDCGEIKTRKGVSSWMEVFVKEDNE